MELVGSPAAAAAAAAAAVEGAVRSAWDDVPLVAGVVVAAAMAYSRTQTKQRSTTYCKRVD